MTTHTPGPRTVSCGSTPDHLDRYRYLKTLFETSTGRELIAYAVLGVDAQGETYYGAHVGRERLDEMKRLAKWLLAFCKEQEKYYSKEPA